jgi:effector-binding domain-containing protein
MQGYDIIDVEEMPHLYVSQSVNASELDMAVMSAFETVWKHMVSHGVGSAGGAFTLFLNRPTNIVNFRAGFLVDEHDMGIASGDIMAGVTPTGQAIHQIHHGSYDGLPVAHDRMLDYCKEQGLRPIAPSWQIYRNDPAVVLEEQLVTDCYQALKA